MSGSIVRDDPNDPNDPALPGDDELLLDPNDPQDPEDPEDPEDPGEDPQDPEPPRQLSRSERRIQALNEATRQEKERADRMEREIQELRSGRAQPQQNQSMTAEQERQMLDAMTPDERSEYRLNKALNEMRVQNAQTQFQLADQSDKAIFDAKAANDPRYKRYAGEVEQRLADLRKNGQNVAREALLYYVIGEKVVKRNEADISKQRKRGQENIARQRAPAGNSRGDVGASRTRSGNSPASRLEGLEI
jgi:hypothetical protein